MNIIFGLITSTMVGSIVFFALLALRPITTRVFSKAWHYYCLLVPLFFLLGGTQVAALLADLLPQAERFGHLAMPIAIYYEMPPNFTRELFMLPEANGLLNAPIIGAEVGEGYVASLSITSILLPHLEAVTPFILSLWALGAVGFIAISTKEYLQYRRLIMQSARSVDIDSEIPIVISIAAHTPMLMGLLRPVIVLPDMYFSDEELEMILAHEMVHFRRKDLLIKMLMLIVNAVHWFNPAAYMLNNQLDTMCELSCDEKVVEEMDAGSRKFYGETILQVLRHSTAQIGLVGNVAFATNLCNSKKKFKRRLINMMNTKKMKKSVVALALAAGVLVVGGGFVVSGMIDSAMPNVPTFVEAVGFSDVYETPVQNDAPSFHAVAQEDLQENEIVQTQFQWPLAEHARVTTPFGSMRDPVTGREEFHSGIDIPAPFGTPILAAMDGYVTFAGWQDGNGYSVLIDHGNGYKTLYAHASRISVNEGQFVNQGETIAFVGSTGRSTGNHLHFEVRFGGVAVDPYAYFAGMDAMQVVGVPTIVPAQGRLEEREHPALEADVGYVIEPRFAEVYTIELERQNASVELVHPYFSEAYPALADNYLSFEVAAGLAADAIYQLFGVCVGGLDGNMFFVRRMQDNAWIGNIFCEDRTTHSPGDELFHFVIDAENGDVLSLYMNTIETPFNG